MPNEELPESLRFTSGWSLGEDGYQLMADQLRRLDAKRFLEFGSGVSTVRLSRDFPDMEILSIDAERKYRDQTAEAIRHHGRPAISRVEFRPLRWQRHGFGLYLSFAPGPFREGVDAVLIDGPPIATRRGREACLYQSFSVLRVGGLVFLDDYVRDTEQQIVRNWLRAFPGALRHVGELHSAHRICMLEKTAEVRQSASLRNLADVWYQTSKHAARAVIGKMTA